MENDADMLIELGFQLLSTWLHAGSNLTYTPASVPPGLRPKLDARSALYAFVQNNEVKYIGKTARSIRKRFIGYCNPGSTQATNRRCFTHIKNGLAESRMTDILIFAPPAKLQYGAYQIDLAAGLEESLIAALNPPWNGGDIRKITEEAELEAEVAKESEVEEQPSSQSASNAEEPMASSAGIAEFTIKLGPTYYTQGYINPGVDASEKIGKDGEAIRVDLGDPGLFVLSEINRRANTNGSVRIIGENKTIADWFRKHFNPDDVVKASVLGTNRILLHRPSA